MFYANDETEIPISLEEVELKEYDFYKATTLGEYTKIIFSGIIAD